MKFSALFILLIFHLNAFSQDEIMTADSQSLSVRIVGEEKKSVSFYLLNDPDKTIQSLEKKKIDKIKYEKPQKTENIIVITDDSRSDRELFSYVVSYLIESGYEIDVFDMEHSTVSVFSASGFRISAEVKNNQVRFSCYVREKTVSSSTSQTRGHIIRFTPPDEEEKKDEKYPGEKRMTADTKEFSALDEICRKYLLTNKGSLEYSTEWSRQL